MALNEFGLEVGSNGDNLNATHWGATTWNGTGYTTAQVSTAQKAHGTRSAHLITDTNSNGAYAHYLIDGTTQIALRVYVYFTTLPSGDIAILWGGAASSQRFHVEVTSSGTVRFRDDASGAQWNGVVTTSVGAMTTGAWYRIEFRATISTSGTAQLTVYPADSMTPVSNMDSGERTGINFGSDPITYLRVGLKASTSSSSSEGYIDDYAYNDGSSTYIGPFSEALATPVVTLGSSTNPSSPGASDGTQTVTWPAVSGAVSYEAWIASGFSPAQGDFTLVDTGVTSPYTFDALPPGSYAYGIKAKAS